MGTFRLGLDFGTSSSKLVIWDFDRPGSPGGLLLSKNGDFRISNSIDLSHGSVRFEAGLSPQEPNNASVLHGVKMLVAAEVANEPTWYAGRKVEMPAGVSARDLMTLCVCRQLQYARECARSVSEGRGDNERLDFQWRLGVPENMLRNDEFRLTFLDIFACADALCGFLEKQNSFIPDTIPNGAAAGLAELAREHGASRKRSWKWSPLPDDVTLYLHSEAAAAVMWALDSPEVPDGRFMLVDIGAGTTNVALLKTLSDYRSSLGKWDKEGVWFLGARSEAIGGMRLETKSEETNAIEGIKKLARTTWYDLLNAPETQCFPGNESERRQWVQKYGPRLYLYGGGSLLSSRNSILKAIFSDSYVPQMNIQLAPTPKRLMTEHGSRVTEQDQVFVRVAYGLACPDGDELRVKHGRNEPIAGGTLAPPPDPYDGGYLGDH